MTVTCYGLLWMVLGKANSENSGISTRPTFAIFSRESIKKKEEPLPVLDRLFFKEALF